MRLGWIDNAGTTDPRIHAWEKIETFLCNKG